MLLSVRSAWQPSDYLPDPAQPDFLDRLQAFRTECSRVPPELLVVLVGDMVTEEALPSYLSMLNRMDATKDESGATHSAVVHSLFLGEDDLWLHRLVCALAAA